MRCCVVIYRFSRGLRLKKGTIFSNTRRPRYLRAYRESSGGVDFVKPGGAGGTRVSLAVTLHEPSPFDDFVASLQRGYLWPSLVPMKSFAGQVSDLVVSWSRLSIS